MNSPLDVFSTIPHLWIQGPSTSMKYNHIFHFLKTRTERPTHVQFMSCAHIDPSGHKAYIQNQVYLFAQIKSSYVRFVVFDHAEFLSIDAQSILRRYLEQFSENVRFVFITSSNSNGSPSLILPIVSRLYKIYISDEPPQRLSSIPVPLPSLDSIHEQYEWIQAAYQSAIPPLYELPLETRLRLGTERWRSDKLYLLSCMNG